MKNHTLDFDDHPYPGLDKIQTLILMIMHTLDLDKNQGFIDLIFYLPYFKLKFGLNFRNFTFFQKKKKRIFLFVELSDTAW